MKFLYAILLSLTCILNATAQDSLLSKKPNQSDSTYQHSTKSLDSVQRDANSYLGEAYHYKNKPLDSIQKAFHYRTDSLQRAYAAPMNKLHTEINKLNHKKDSLTRLKLPTTSITHKIDSTEREQTKKLNELNSKIGKVKKETLGKISSLHLAPEAQKGVDALTKNINGFSVPNNFFTLPGMNSNLPAIQNISALKLPPNLSIPSSSIPSLLNNGKLPSLSQLEGSLSEFSKLRSLQNAANAKALEKDVMNVASQNAEVKSIVQGQNSVTNVQKQLGALKNPKKADSLAMTQLKPAVNHFLGKEQELQSAMGQVSKLKQKYSSVKSMTDLPKRAPNPLKDKPWIERVVPGLNYFIRGYSGYTFVDFNPYIGWKFNPHLTASIGWNQRVGFHSGTIGTPMYDRVYGVRGTVSYLWTHGILFTASPEVMKAYIPIDGSMDEKHQALLWGVYAGVRKNFPIYKSFSGYSEVLYHFSQKPGQNIYGDPAVFRFGFEVKLKKRVNH